MSIVYQVAGREVEITHPERVLFPESNITKGDLADYYYRIADIMVPYMQHRAVTMHRFPEGIGHEGFYHKDAPDYFPSWIDTKAVKKKEDGLVNYVVCNDAATLVYLAQQACITPHIWLSRIDKLHYPDRMIFDLDPDKQPFTVVQETALAMHDLLSKIGLVSFALITGSQGIHVVVPLDRTVRFAEVRAFAQMLAEYVVRQDTSRLTVDVRKDKREGRLFIDTLRNSFGATAVAPYAVRAREGAPVATPITWQEVKRTDLKPDKYTIKTIFRRLTQIEDPWKSIDKQGSSVRAAQAAFKKIRT